VLHDGGLLCSRTGGEIKFYFCEDFSLWYVGKNWEEAFERVALVCHREIDSYWEGESIARLIPLKVEVSELYDIWEEWEREADYANYAPMAEAMQPNIMGNYKAGLVEAFFP
jgi:hypothetical protein